MNIGNVYIIELRGVDKNRGDTLDADKKYNAAMI